MFKLVVTTEVLRAESAGEHAATMLGDITVALHADGVLHRTGASVRLQACQSVAHPGLAEIADCAHHSQTGDMRRAVFYNAITLRNALLLAALSAHRQSLHRPAEVAEGAVLLHLLALVALHAGIAGMIG